MNPWGLDRLPLVFLSRKKLSNFLHAQQWKGASNYVAKRYIEPVDRSVYFEDVQLQMEAKLWGEDYNRHKPPKQVREPHLPPSHQWLASHQGETQGSVFISTVQGIKS